MLLLLTPSHLASDQATTDYSYLFNSATAERQKI